MASSYGSCVCEFLNVYIQTHSKEEEEGEEEKEGEDLS